MGQNLANADAALKEFYLPPIREQLNSKTMILEQVEKNSRDVEGRRAILSLHVLRNAGVGARAEGGTLPAAGRQGYVEERVPLRSNYARIELTGQVIAAMKSDAGSFTRAIDSETKGAVRDSRRDVNRQVMGTSDGKIATCGTTTAATLVVLATATSDVQMRQFHVGQRVDIGTLAAPTTVASSAIISAIDTTNKTLTIDQAVTTTGSHFVFNQGSGGDSTSNGGQKELTGLQTIVDSTGTLFNVNPSTTPSWSATEMTNAGTDRAPTEQLFAQAIHNVEIAGNGTIKAFVTSAGVHRNFANQLTAQKRFVGSIDLKGGYKALEICAGGSPVALWWERDCPAKTALGLDWEHLTQHEMSDWEWMDEDGAVLSRVSGADAYEAVLFKYHELTTDERNAHVKVGDLAEA